MTVRKINETDYCGLSTDTKPTKETNEINGQLDNLPQGKWFLETDTKKIYFWDSVNWTFMYTY